MMKIKRELVINKILTKIRKNQRRARIKRIKRKRKRKIKVNKKLSLKKKIKHSLNLTT